MPYLEEAAQKRQSIRQQQSQSNDFDSMLAELKKIQLASLMGSQGKSTVILTDQTDLGDKMSELTTKLVSAVEGLDSSTMDKQELDALAAVKQAVSELNTTFLQTAQLSTRYQKELLAAIKGQKLNVEAPVVNLPEPKVTIRDTKVDFTPLQNTIKEYFQTQDTPEESTYDLECYRAQDITEDGDVQYVGFVNPEGQWYIIENRIKDNSLRYVFGSGGYSKAFKKAAQYQYTLLNEAIDALSA